MAVRYYIRDIIYHCCTQWLTEVNCITTHKTLVDQILECERDRVLFVTFNYDELLEDALSDHGFSVDTFEGYINRTVKFALYKLHGSVNWVRLVFCGASHRKTRDEVINGALQLTEPQSGTGFRLSRNIDTDWVERDFVGIPAIAIPINRKLNFECPVEHIAHLRQELPKIKRILVIGWQGTESNFTDLLRQNLGTVQKLCVVSAADASTVMNHLQTTLSPKLNVADCQSFDSGFSKFVGDRAGIPFFSSLGL